MAARPFPQEANVNSVSGDSPQESARIHFVLELFRRWPILSIVGTAVGFAMALAALAVRVFGLAVEVIPSAFVYAMYTAPVSVPLVLYAIRLLRVAQQPAA